ncbi:TonB-dependent siderophore receptor [Pseudomonas sp. F1_0610]|uniref:TonB-dependent siderophore receptor n=1 Tax=Pseudomonas sp. F1_0610 TaxID=3114284 RepID=UPI0039C3EB47
MSRKGLTLQPTLLAICIAGLSMQALANNQEPVELGKTLVTAQEELKQAPGVSIITAQDLEKMPPVNDISEILRKQPGVNLTGNSGSGARGNNRQIDIRGMGPENTMILVDGKPVSSRNAVRYGWRGDRDSRGDTNWVPADQIERIEVLRGPAAARYGSGAAGGVINIITKGTTEEVHGNVTVFTNFPTHKAEGATKRIDFGLSGPLSESISYRVYGNFNKTEGDKGDINKKNTIGNFVTAGREGVRNKDVNGLLKWQVTPDQIIEFESGFSRQGNIFAGDSMNNAGGANPVADRAPWIGRETNIMYRENYALTHRGDWDNLSSLSYIQYEKTRNRRLSEGLMGAVEGNISGDAEFGTITLENYTVHSELHVPFYFGVDQMLTVGAEWQQQKMNDPVSNNLDLKGSGGNLGVSDTNRSTKAKSNLTSIFIENNMALGARTTLTPGLRFDHHSQSGDNWSPAVNILHELNDNFTLKAGIARAYKAPNLYQSNNNYLLMSGGNGCWNVGPGGCYLQGNEKLKAETSVNKELGLEFKKNGWAAGITWFRNDYKNKVQAGHETLGLTDKGRYIFQWENVPKAVVEGFEGSLLVPVSDSMTWTTNFTYMVQSKDKRTNEPLSIIPKFTVNSMYDWQVTEAWSLNANVSWYGKQTPPKYSYRGAELEGDARRQQSPYAIASLASTYKFNKNYRLTVGVNNLFDKRLYREGNSVVAGAKTYNEPGRAVYTSVTASF